MPQSPQFTLTGGRYSAGNLLKVFLEFANPDDMESVDAYEWYLDNILIPAAITSSMSVDVSCGIHSIGVRLLSNGSWCGTQEIPFATCKELASSALVGPSTLVAGQSASYSVILTFTDNTTLDISSLYTFSTDPDGCTVSGNVVTAVGNAAGDSTYDVTLTADDGDGSPFTLDITIDNQAGILVVDIYDDATLNVIGLIDNAEVTYNHISAYTGANTVPDGLAPADALILASDLIDQPVLKWRFEFNLALLKLTYPATTDFIFYIKGRSANPDALSGSYTVACEYNLKNEATTMWMDYTPGSYLPSAVGGGQVGTITPANPAPIVAGDATGSYLEADLVTILQFDYSTLNNAVTCTPAT